MNNRYATFHFLLEIDGVAAGGFKECSSLSTNTDIFDYRFISNEDTVKKTPGLTKDSSIILKRGIIQNSKIWEWIKTGIDGPVERKNGIITLLDETREPVCKWHFTNGFITSLIGPSMHQTSNDVALEAVEITHEGLTIIE